MPNLAWNHEWYCPASKLHFWHKNNLTKKKSPSPTKHPTEFSNNHHGFYFQNVSIRKILLSEFPEDSITERPGYNSETVGNEGIRWGHMPFLHVAKVKRPEAKFRGKSRLKVSVTYTHFPLSSHPPSAWTSHQIRLPLASLNSELLTPGWVYHNLPFPVTSALWPTGLRESKVE